MGSKENNEKQIEKNKFLLEVGERIRILRQEKGISQEELGRRCKFPKDKQAIERVENGRYNVSAFIYKEIAEALEVKLPKLFEA